MKGTPFKTRRISPFMRAGQGLMGETLQEPEVTIEEPEVTIEEPEVVTEEPNKAAEQMQVATPGDKDEDKYKKRNIKYNATVEEANELYGNGSTEEISTELGEMGSVINTDGTITFGLSGGGWDFGDNTETVSSEKIFDISAGTGRILGESIGNLHFLSKGVSKQVFSYGTVEKVKQPNEEGGYEDEFVENITITAKNHPLYGNTYTRTSVANPERGTVKPIEDLNSVLSNYDYDNRQATAGIFSISTKGEKPKWHFTADSDFERAIKEGWLTNKDGSTLDSSERNKLMQEFVKASERFKDTRVTSTKLNEK
jgi:hypothetical protein